MAEEAKKDAKKEGEDKDEAPAAAPAAAASAGPSKLVLALSALGLMLVSAGVPSYFLLTKKPPEKVEDLAADAAGAEGGDAEHGDAGHHGAEEALQEGEEPLGAIYPLETFTVNLSGGRYLRAQVQFEFTTRDVPRKFYSRLVPLRDAIIGSLVTRTGADLETVRGKETLKADLRELVNQQLGAEAVKRVYFSQFVIQ